MAKAKMTHPSKGILQTFEFLKSGKSVNFDKMVSDLGVKPVTAMVFICALRKDFGADIETERDGRRVISYRLNNASDIAPKMVLKSTAKASKPKAAKSKVVVSKTKTIVSRKSSRDTGEVPTVDSDYDISEVTDAELADLKEQLGIG